jgi:hypothetical protein
MWDVKLIEGEIEQLKREQKHLTSKSLERPLNTWEKLRLTAMFRDVNKLVIQLSQFTDQFSQSTNRHHDLSSLEQHGELQ